ncbi:MAG TPA: prepilin-type N-terminal cleavage/methylation domain-containing protein [Candidatus Limnocylindria bacterium]|nr:prepilin-type N-terminal cleavage/methylation domain-containing protein [Candidatus Limnocylindria bacterium]
MTRLGKSLGQRESGAEATALQTLTRRTQALDPREAFGVRSLQRRCSCYRDISAFTIIELMIAISIFMMILVSIYSVWSGILKASQAARSAADSAQRARISMRAIEDALTTAQMFTANMPPQSKKPYYSFLADMSGDFGSLSFVAHLPATFPGVGRFGDQIVRRVTFRCVPGKDNTMDLVMEQGPMLMAVEEGYEPYSLVLAKDVQMFGFEFWGRPDPIRKPNADPEWLDHWDSTNSLPILVRVGLGLGKTDKKGDAQDLVVKVVALPARAVAPEWQNPMGAAAFGGGGLPGQQGGKPQ